MSTFCSIYSRHLDTTSGQAMINASSTYNVNNPIKAPVSASMIPQSPSQMSSGSNFTAGITSFRVASRSLDHSFGEIRKPKHL